MQTLTFPILAELVELKAKAASIFPFALGAAYALYTYHQISPLPLILYFIAMFLFNCFVDTWDNWNDYHHALDTADYQRNTNIIGRESLSIPQIRVLLIFLFGTSLILGLITAALVGWPVFLLGLLCYLVGIFYSWGPKPLSSLPVGEIASGLTMGYLIFLMSVYINAHTTFSWNASTLGKTFLVALPSVLLISNLMLANNTCDLDEDEANARFTIVHYIGRPSALTWWLSALIAAFTLTCLAVALHLLPATCLAILLLIPWTVHQARPYLKKQVKRETFRHSVNILMFFQFALTLLFYIGLLLPH
ncbi:MAG: prenyltransferase [Streptococcaceae bacterium]|jgi:1,4-dihydroxy-2-naphthoate octaprenyltransferase|nr:prenyltransferase [Streptococcaceae bacterium]